MESIVGIFPLPIKGSVASWMAFRQSSLLAGTDDDGVDNDNGDVDVDDVDVDGVEAST